MSCFRDNVFEKYWEFFYIHCTCQQASNNYTSVTRQRKILLTFVSDLLVMWSPEKMTDQHKQFANSIPYGINLLLYI